MPAPVLNMAASSAGAMFSSSSCLIAPSASLLLASSCAPAQGDRANRDNGGLGYRAWRDREQRELEPDYQGVLNEIYAVGADRFGARSL